MSFVAPHMSWMPVRGGGGAIVVGDPGTPFGDAGDRSVYTATGLPAVAADERGVICIGARSGTTRTAVSVTIGGQNAVELNHVNNSGTTAAIWLGPLGASGDVVVTWSGSQARCMVGVFPTKGIADPVAFDIASSTAGTLSAPIDCPAGGAIFACTYNGNTGAPTGTGGLSSGTTDFTALAEAHHTVGMGKVFDTAQVDLACGVNFPTEANQAMVLVSLYPVGAIAAGFYETDFAEYAAGAQPSDWTKQYATGNFTALVQTVAAAMSGKALRWTKTAGSTQGLSWNAVPAAQDAEVLFRFRAIESSSSLETMITAALRGAGATGTESLYRSGATWYAAGGTRWIGGLAKYVSGAYTALGSPSNGPSPTFNINTWGYARFRLIENRLQRKIWYPGAAEPDWQEELTDNALTAAGWVGLMSDGPNPDVEIDYFAASVKLSGGAMPITIPVPI